LPEREALQFVSSLLRVVSFLHDRNILHRDINPDNIILQTGEGGHVRLEDFVIIDFGIAKRGWSKSNAKEGLPIGGKRGWSAPEQFLSQGISTPSSDIYSIGVLLLYLLIGMDPYMNGFITHEGRILKDLNPYMRKETAEVIRVATSPDPLDRYETAQDMLTAILGSPPPYIMCSEKKYYLGRVTEIGRVHVCDNDCLVRGFTRRLDVAIEDPKRFISKHHARIYMEPNRKVFLVDLGAKNKTALRREGEKYQILVPNRSYKLKDGDEVALAYNDSLGPYKTLTFKRDNKSNIK
jgi:serine/threonine protein kinase